MYLFGVLMTLSWTSLSMDLFLPNTSNQEGYKAKKLFHPSKYLKNIYITLGPYFSDKSDERVFRVGASLDYLTLSKDRYQRKLVEEFENEITGKNIDRDIEHVRLTKENFMKLMTMNYEDKTEEEQIKDFIIDQNKIAKITEFSSGKTSDEGNENSIARSDSVGYSEKQKVIRNQNFLDSLEILINEVRQTGEIVSDAQKNEAEELRKTEMFQVFQKLLNQKNLGTELLKNASGSGSKKTTRHSQLILKKISLTESIMEFYKTYCDRDYQNCRKRLTSEEMQKETKAGHMDVKNEIWTVTNGSPRLALSLIKLVVTTPSNEKFEFGISDLNEYKYRGFYKGEPLDFKRIFIFFDITNEVTNLSQFKYEIFYKESLIKGPYNFSSNVRNPVAKPKIVSMGYHDTSVFGQTAIDKLSTFHYDLLIIPGNIGIEGYQNNFRNIEDYFEQMEKNFTRAPVMILPGENEKIDNFAMFGSKFLTLNVRNYLGMDVFQFYVNNISIYFLNVTKIVNSNYRFSQIYEVFLDLLKNNTSLEKKTNRSPKWRILVTNEPLFCSGVSIDNQKCMKNLFLLRPFHDLARAYGIDIFLSGGTSYYERVEMPQFSEFRHMRIEKEEKQKMGTPMQVEKKETDKPKQELSNMEDESESMEDDIEQENLDGKDTGIHRRVLQSSNAGVLNKIKVGDMENKLYKDVLDEDIKEQNSISRQIQKQKYGSFIKGLIGR
jgi:hypothetical protein